MKVISVLNKKGGTGKSTISENLAISLAHENKRVLLIDVDPGQNSSVNFNAWRRRTQERIETEGCIDTDIPYSRRLALPGITTTDIALNELLLNIKGYKQLYDYIVIDVAGERPDLLQLAIKCGVYGMVIVPLQPSNHDYAETHAILKMIRELNVNVMDGAIRNVYVVLNRVDTNAKVKLVKAIREEVTNLTGIYSAHIMKAELGNRLPFRESINYGMSVAEYAMVRRGCEVAAYEFGQFVDEVHEILGDGGEG